MCLSIMANAQIGQSDDGAPKVGEVAPLFTLKMLDEDKEISLENFAGVKPVVLIFGSYT